MALALLAVAAVSPHSRSSGAAFFMAGFCILAVSIALVIALSAVEGARHISRVLLWILFGCCFGLIVGYQRCGAQLRTGLPAQTVRWVEGRLLKDAAPLKGGRGMLKLDVDRCGGVDCAATASGCVTIFFERLPESFAGQMVRCSVVNLYQGDDSHWMSSSREMPRVLGWRFRWDQMRAMMLTALRTIVRTGGGEADFLAALLLGIREDPADPFVELFRRAGVSHVLALSGMHLGIVAGFVMLLARPVLGTSRAYLLSLPLLFVYIWTVGAGPSILRAGIMYLLMAGRLVGHRRPDPLSVLSTAFVCGLLIDPSSLSSLSFQLSFLALFGIMTIGSALAERLSSSLPRTVALPLAMSVGAQIATAPVVIARFGVLRPVGIVTSLAISFLIVVYLWAGICFVILSIAAWLTAQAEFIMILGEASWFIMNQVRRIIGFVVSCLAQVPGIELGAGAAWIAGMGLAVYILWRRYLEYRYKRSRLELSAGN